MVKPAYFARPDQFKLTVDSWIRIYCFTSRMYFNYGEKPEELYIISFEKGHGRKPRPFSKQIM